MKKSISEIVKEKPLKVKSQTQKKPKKDNSHFAPMWVKNETNSSLEQDFIDLAIIHCPELIWNKDKLQYRFSHNWKFDFVLMENEQEISNLKIAIECEGLFAQKIFVKGRNRSFSSRHLRPLGYTEDCHKYNQAILEGWSVLRFTSIDFNPKNINYNPYKLFEQIKELIKLKKKL